MTMKRHLSVLILLVVTILLTACGEKSQEDVLSKLEDTMEKMNGYKAEATMNMNTGQEEQNFNIGIWHKKNDMYRVALKNDQDEKGNQIILKNKDGVFVLTPALDKSFKFQSEWPDNSSQPYLYQSLVKDIKEDKEADFESTESAYIFKTKTNYQSNNNLPYQEIHFDKKTYTPLLVKVKDKDKNTLVEVKFTTFDTEAKFAEDDFSMDKNMATGESETTASAEVQDDTLTVLFPSYLAGAELTEKKEVDLEKGKRVILSFSGEKNFTLVEEKSEAITTMSAPKEVSGDIVNLGNAVGALSENTIEWTYDGVDFILASEELTREELIQVAQSMQNKEVK